MQRDQMLERTNTLLALVLLVSPAVTLAEDPVARKPKTAKVTFRDQIGPLFRRRCTGCHGGGQPKADLDLSRYVAAMAGGSSGEVLVPGDPLQSRLYLLASHAEEPHMPPKRPRLPPAELTLIRQWIDGGLLATRTSRPRTSKRPRSLLSRVGPSLRRPVTKGRGDQPGARPFGWPVVAMRTSARGRAVVALAASPWSSLVAVGGIGQVLVYDAVSGKLSGVLPFPEGRPHQLSFSADGEVIWAAGGQAGVSGAVVGWNVRSGRRLFAVTDGEDVVLGSALDPSGKRLAIGSDRVVRIVETATGRTIRRLAVHTDWVVSIGFSPDGRRLVTGDRGGGLVLWETRQWDRVSTLAGHRGAVTGVAWRPDGRVVASASQDGTVRQWEAEGGRPLRNWMAHEGGVLGIACRADGQLATVGRDRVARTWNQAGAEQDRRGPLDDIVTRVALVGVPGWLVVGDWTGSLRLWRGSEPKPRATWQPGVASR
ncbi:MAG: hypothetical protein CMJ69_07440 [Planctomycetaceae bacterium]|nr:hypothetical protein [Planctomycetaceae bacterium]|tara:strand:+ start:517 stop:1965 length:1449 start_codon:yes stop_codon:yes gene_type:complete